MRIVLVAALVAVCGCTVARGFVAGVVDEKYAKHRAEISATLDDAKAEGASIWEILGVVAGGGALTTLGGSAAVRARNNIIQVDHRRAPKK